MNHRKAIFKAKNTKIDHRLIKIITQVANLAFRAPITPEFRPNNKSVYPHRDVLLDTK